MKGVSKKSAVCAMCGREKPIKRIRLTFSPDSKTPSGRYWLGHNCLVAIKNRLDKLAKGEAAEKDGEKE